MHLSLRHVRTLTMIILPATLHSGRLHFHDSMLCWPLTSHVMKHSFATPSLLPLLPPAHPSLGWWDHPRCPARIALETGRMGQVEHGNVFSKTSLRDGRSPLKYIHFLTCLSWKVHLLCGLLCQCSCDHKLSCVQTHRYNGYLDTYGRKSIQNDCMTTALACRPFKSAQCLAIFSRGSCGWNRLVTRWPDGSRMDTCILTPRQCPQGSPHF